MLLNYFNLSLFIIVINNIVIIYNVIDRVRAI